jgi:uncharacterized protein (DUF983 family)
LSEAGAISKGLRCRRPACGEGPLFDVGLQGLLILTLALMRSLKSLLISLSTSTAATTFPMGPDQPGPAAAEAGCARLDQS